jgi:hypothetical protein
VPRLPWLWSVALCAGVSLSFTSYSVLAADTSESAQSPFSKTADRAKIKPNLRAAAEEKINKALASPTRLEFVETPLSDVIDFLKSYHGIEIQLDKKSLENKGIDSNTQITKSLQGISLASALRLLLRDLDLTYTIENEVLVITMPEEVKPVARIHRLGGLVGRLEEAKGGRLDIDALAAMVKQMVQPDSWRRKHRRGVMAAMWLGTEPVLVVSHDQAVQEQIAELLERLREASGDKPPS